MCDKAVDALLPALKFVFDYFAANEILGKLNNVFSNDIFFFDVDSDVVTFLMMVSVLKIMCDHRSMIIEI